MNRIKYVEHYTPEEVAAMFGTTTAELKRRRRCKLFPKHEMHSGRPVYRATDMHYSQLMGARI